MRIVMGDAAQVAIPKRETVRKTAQNRLFKKASDVRFLLANLILLVQIVYIG